MSTLKPYFLVVPFSALITGLFNLGESCRGRSRSCC